MGGTGFLTREIVTLAVEKFFSGEDEDEINELRSVSSMITYIDVWRYK